MQKIEISSILKIRSPRKFLTKSHNHFPVELKNTKNRNSAVRYRKKKIFLQNPTIVNAQKKKILADNRSKRFATF